MKTGKSEYRREYLRILTSGLAGKEDYEFARELIDAGYATGNYQVSKMRDDAGQVTVMVGFKVNTAGRLFADQLEDSISRSTWSHRAKLAAIWLFGVATTLVLGLVSGLGTEVLKNYLPK